MENQNNNNVFKFILIVVFLVLVVFGVLLIFKNSRTNKEKAVTTGVASPTSYPLRGVINIVEDVSEIKIKNQINLKLMANSDGENVTAFDTIVSYEPEKVEFVKASTINPDFKVYAYNKDKKLTLTVAKTNLGNKPSIFKGEDMVILIFKPKMKGTSTFKILPMVGAETTKFVNEKTEIIYPNVNEININVN